MVKQDGMDSVEFMLLIGVICVVLGGFVFGVYHCEATTSPGAARGYAERWVRQTYGDAALGTARLECVSRDSDGDGYISCTMVPPGETRPIGIECSSGFYVTACNNTGCRMSGAVR